MAGPAWTCVPHHSREMKSPHKHSPQSRERTGWCREWDVNSWSATRWLPHAAQRVSVALHKAVAYEYSVGSGSRNTPVE